MTRTRARLRWLPLLLSIAAVIAAGTWLALPMRELVRELSGHGFDVQAQRLRGAGALLALASSGFVVARALGARAHLSLAAVGACLPWLFGLVATRSAFEVEIPGLPMVASGGQAVLLADLLSEALPWSVLGAAATAGLALGALVTAFVDRGSDEPVPELALLGAVALTSTMRVGQYASLLWMLPSTTRRGPAEDGDPELRGIAPLFGTEAIAEQLDPLLSRFSALATGQLLASAALTVVALVATIVLFRRRAGSRAPITALALPLIVAALGLVDIGLDRSLSRAATLRARPAWTSVEGLRVPASTYASAEAIPFAGCVVRGGFIDGGGREHPLSAEALAPAFLEAADEDARRDAAYRAVYAVEEANIEAPTDETSVSNGPFRSEPPRRAALAVDRGTTGAEWRTILAGAHQAHLTTLCIAVEETREGEPPATPRTTGIAWVDALAHHPASLRCFATVDALSEGWNDELLLHLHLRGRLHHALAARPRTDPIAPPVVCPVTDDGTLAFGPPRPPLYLLVEDAMRTSDLVTFDEDDNLDTLGPVLMTGPLPNHPETPGPQPDAPPYPLHEPEGHLGPEVPMVLLHASPPEITGEPAIEIYVAVEEPFEAPLDALLDTRLRAASDALAACYVAERRRSADHGGMVQLTWVADARAVPFDVGCTGSGRSSPALCECFDAALTETPADPDTARTEEGFLRRLRLVFWLQARDADRTP